MVWSIATISTIESFQLPTLKVRQLISTEFATIEIDFGCPINNGSICTIDLVIEFGSFFDKFLSKFFY
jgi:hypothetical protein